MSSYHYAKYPRFRFAAPMSDRTWPDVKLVRAPLWCSVDLRDGNQALIDPMTIVKKLRFWELLIRCGFKEVEIGFPSAAQVEFDFARKLIEEGRIPDDVNVQVLTQARRALIERTFESLAGVRRAIVHVYNSTSAVQRDKAYRMSRAEILDIAVAGAVCVQENAAKYPDTEWDFQYSPESFSQTEPDYAIEVCEAVCRVWQPENGRRVIINLPATVEAASPNIFADQVEYFCRGLPSRKDVVISLHTHNDRGCAVAAAEQAMMAGADRVEGTLLGNGERTGNMDIITAALNFYSQGIDPGLDFSNMPEIVRTVTECNDLPIHPRHPYAGELVFTAFSGSHQDAIKKCLAYDKAESGGDVGEIDDWCDAAKVRKCMEFDEAGVAEGNLENAAIHNGGEAALQKGAGAGAGLWDVAYLPIDPLDVGRTYQDVVRINSQSGKGGVAYVLQANYGVEMPRWLQIRFSGDVQRMAENESRELSHTQIWQLFQDIYMANTSPYALLKFSLVKEEPGDSEGDSVTAYLSNNGRELTISAEAFGTLSAFIKALEAHTGKQLRVLNYNEHALSAGTRAEAIAYVELNVDGVVHVGVATSQDTVSSMLKATLVGLNAAICGEATAGVQRSGKQRGIFK